MLPRPPWRSTAAAVGLTVVVVLIFASLIHRNRPAPYAAGTNDYIGRTAPDFTLPTLDGTPVTLSALKGHVVVLDLWATWCPPCVAELPANTKIAARYADRGVKFFAVNLGETPEQVKAFLDRKKLDVPVLLDPTSGVGEAFGAQYIPLLVVIDATGRIVAHDNVPPDDVETTLPRWIESALKSGQAS